MRIAITGSSGGVGRGVVRHVLDQGHQVASIDRVAWPGDPPAGAVHFSHTVANLTDYAAFERALAGCDALIHLAAIPSPTGQLDHVVHNNNVTSSYNALSACAKLGVRRVCLASSVNATGLSYSRWPRFDYLPLDEAHPTYNEDAYSLSKWICEQQADAFARRHEDMRIASLRFHWVVPERSMALRAGDVIEQRHLARSLWAYTELAAAARACLLSVTADFRGHEVFYIVAPNTAANVPSADLCARWYPTVPLRGVSGRSSLFDSSKAERLLGWRHDLQAHGPAVPSTGGGT